MNILKALRPFALSAVLIVAVSALLVWSDGGDRRAAEQQELPAAERQLRVAIVQHTSQISVDQGVAGMIDALKKRGFAPGPRFELKQFNAQGDMTTANDIARQVTDGSFDLVLTSSTLSLQAVANANRTRKVKHVFGVVADAKTAGVGIGADPLDHPPYMAGYNVFADVDKALVLAREMNPGFRRVGLVWHTAETNSQAYAAATREAAKRLGIEVIEANAEAPTSVGEAASSVLARGVDAIVVTGDVTVLVGIDGMIKVATRAGVPVFTVIPPNARKGALFDLGADYFAVGQEVGNLAADVLEGRDPATIPVENRVPAQFLLNEVALEAAGPRWKVTNEMRERAHVLITRDGERTRPAASP